jgi:hypothetical protein
VRFAELQRVVLARQLLFVKVARLFIVELIVSTGR